MLPSAVPFSSETCIPLTSCLMSCLIWHQTTGSMGKNVPIWVTLLPLQQKAEHTTPQLQVRQVDPKVTFSGLFLLSGSLSLPSLQLSLVLSEANHGMARPTSEQCPQSLQSSRKNISGEGASTSGVKSQGYHSCLSSWESPLLTSLALLIWT